MIKMFRFNTGFHLQTPPQNGLSIWIHPRQCTASLRSHKSQRTPHLDENICSPPQYLDDCEAKKMRVVSKLFVFYKIYQICIPGIFRILYRHLTIISQKFFMNIFLIGVILFTKFLSREGHL